MRPWDHTCYNLISCCDAAWTLNQPVDTAPARAMYGVDIMVDTNLQPKVLEVQVS